MLAAIVVAALYYGWPVIEAIILVLPIPDPKDSIDKVKNAANNASDMVSGALSSNRGPPAANAPTGEYSQNLEAQIDAFLESDESSDDESGKNNNNDEESKNEQEIDVIGGSELIDLGGGN